MAGTTTPRPEEDATGDALAAEGVGLALLDGGLRYLWVNEAVATWDNLPADLHRGQSLFDLHPELPRRALARLLKTGRQERLVLRRTDAHRLRRTLHLQPVATLGGELFILDVELPPRPRSLSARRRATEEGQADLTLGRERLRFEFLGLAGGAYLLLDPLGRIRSWNRGAGRLFGHSAERVLGQGLTFLYPPEPGVRREALAALWSAREEGAFEGEARLLRADGRPLSGRLTLTRLSDGQGMTAGFLACLSEQQPTEARGEEEERGAWEAFLGVAAHTLRSPMTGLQGAASLIAERLRGTGDEDLSVLAGLLSDEVTRLSTLLDEIADAFRRGERRLPFNRRPLHLLELLLPLLDAAEVAYPRHRFRLDVERAQPCLVLADPARLGEALRNLIDNAARYAPEGSEVTVGVATKGGEVEVSVRDQGIGIKAADLPHVFERFYRGEEARALDPLGMGLGLYLVADVVRAHGGEITVASEPGAGTVFTVHLPLIRPDS